MRTGRFISYMLMYLHVYSHKQLKKNRASHCRGGGKAAKRTDRFRVTRTLLR